jgi:gliding motility-associated-like protein
VTGNQITVEAEINRTAPYTSGTLAEGDVVSKHDNTADVNYLLRPNHAYITTTNGPFATPDICDISLNKTYHIAMVYDGVSLKFYRNGFLMSQVAATGNLVQNSWKTRIGYYFNQVYNENFIGYINEVRIWNVARTQAQIQAYMNSSLPTPPAQTGLLAYYIFNSLINQQGNPAWNGFLGGFAAIGQTNPNCVFTADNQCCVPLQGTFTGNSICPGQNGLLNFHLVSTPANPPYTLSYSDQTNIYSQPNVLDNIQFPVSVNPSITTQYPLLKITDASNCSTDVTGEAATITVFSPGQFMITPDTSICVNSSVQLNVSGGQLYTWSPVAGLNDPNISNPVAQPIQSTKFYVSGKDMNNCTVMDSVTVSILPKPVFNAPPNQSVCKGTSVVLDGYNGTKNLYTWSPATYLNDPNSPAPVASPDQDIVYHVTISDPVCVQYDSSFDVQVVVNPSPAVIAQKSNDIDCSKPSSQLSASGASTYQWLPVTGLSDPNSATPVATLSSTAHFVVRGTSANGCYGYDSVTVIVAQTGQNAFSVPNAFTPNNDGVNDCFGIHSWGNVTLQDFSIYNRWGQRVFETKNPSACWDGTYQGQKQESGNYIYLIKANSFCGNVVRQGTLILIR